ncbi:MAG TPA: VIT1/CCC1 transporter family protein, partial [Candidatus Saccharimonadales bacterium]|nr:VIT1/CCC1 transporter family protein [Candidatus Saccharimonadales bacterium]
SQLGDTPVRDGFLMAGTFLLGAMLPIIPYIFMRGLPAVIAALAISAVALLGVGLIKARVTGQRLWVGGGEVLLVGTGAAVAGYLFGVLLPHAFGLRLTPAA